MRPAGEAGGRHIEAERLDEAGRNRRRAAVEEEFGAGDAAIIGGLHERLQRAALAHRGIRHDGHRGRLEVRRNLQRQRGRADVAHLVEGVRFDDVRTAGGHAGRFHEEPQRRVALLRIDERAVHEEIHAADAVGVGGLRGNRH